MFWIYDDPPAGRATLHNASCSFCNDGRERFDDDCRHPMVQQARSRSKPRQTQRRGRSGALTRFRSAAAAMQGPIQVGAEDQEAIGQEGKRQAEGLGISLDPKSRDLGIELVDRELNIERLRDGPDIG